MAAPGQRAARKREAGCGEGGELCIWAAGRKQVRHSHSQVAGSIPKPSGCHSGWGLACRLRQAAPTSSPSPPARGLGPSVTLPEPVPPGPGAGAGVGGAQHCRTRGPVFACFMVTFRGTSMTGSGTAGHTPHRTRRGQQRCGVSAGSVTVPRAPHQPLHSFLQFGSLCFLSSKATGVGMLSSYR